MVDSLSKCILDAPTPLHPDLLGADGAATTSGRDSGRPCFPSVCSPHGHQGARVHTSGRSRLASSPAVTGVDHRNLCSDSRLPSDLTPSSRRSNYTALLAFPGTRPTHCLFRGFLLGGGGVCVRRGADRHRQRYTHDTDTHTCRNTRRHRHTTDTHIQIHTDTDRDTYTHRHMHTQTHTWV